MTPDLTGKKIAVLMGGPGSEREVSLKSGEGVVDALRSLGADVTPVDVHGADFTVPPGVEIAFNVIHGTFGEDGQVQRILESPLEDVVVTNSIPPNKEALASKKVKYVSIGKLLGEAIRRIHNKDSVSSLFV